VYDAFKFVVYKPKIEISSRSLCFSTQPKVCRVFLVCTSNLCSKHIHLIAGLVFPMTLHPFQCTQHRTPLNITTKICSTYSYSNRPQKWCQCCVHGIYLLKITISSLQNAVFSLVHNFKIAFKNGIPDFIRFHMTTNLH
jgi:hypothetical protein